MRIRLPYLAARGLGLISIVTSCALGYLACMGVYHLGFDETLRPIAAGTFAGFELFKLFALNLAMNPLVGRLHRVLFALAYVGAMSITAMALGAYQKHASSEIDAADATLVRAHRDAVASRQALDLEIGKIETTLGAPGRSVAEIEVDARRWANSKITCGKNYRDAGCAQQEAVSEELAAARRRVDALANIERLSSRRAAIVVPELPDQVVARNARVSKPFSELSMVDRAAALLREWVLALIELLLIGFVAAQNITMRAFERGLRVEASQKATDRLAKVAEAGVSTVSTGVSAVSTLSPPVKTPRNTHSNVERWLLVHMQANGFLAGTQRDWAIQAKCSDSTMSIAVRRLVSDGVCAWETAHDGSRVLSLIATVQEAMATTGLKLALVK